jgi:hypothetical protein
VGAVPGRASVSESLGSLIVPPGGLPESSRPRDIAQSARFHGLVPAAEVLVRWVDSLTATRPSYRLRSGACR